MIAILVVACFVVVAIYGCGYFPYATFYRGGKGDDIPGAMQGLEDDQEG